MEIKCRDTYFYYLRDGKLVQQILLEGTLSLPAVAIVDGGPFGIVRADIEQKGDAYVCYAPLAYPNLIDGAHTATIAKITLLHQDRALYSGTVHIGNYRPWTLYIASDICTDYTWCNGFEHTRILSTEMINANLKAMDDTDDQPSASQHRWNMNQTVELEWFLENATEEEIQALFRREKEGRIQISPTYNSNLSGLMSTEQAIRSLYRAREMEIAHGISIDTLEHIEMPTITWGMMSIYAGAGIRYFLKAWLDFNSPYLRRGDDVPLFRWVGPDGSSVLTFCDRKSNLKWSYSPGYFLVEDHPFAEKMSTLHDWFINAFENSDQYPFDALLLNGVFGDLHEKSLFEVEKLAAFVAAYQQEDWAYPRVVNGTWRQYFEHVEKSGAHLGVVMPSKRGDSGVSWEDWPAHYAMIYSRFKSGVEAYFAAEALNVLSWAKGGSRCLSDEAAGAASDGLRFMNLLGEHPWNGWEEDEKWRSMKKRREWAERLHQSATRLRAGAVPDGIGRYYNALSWDRTEPVETPDGVQFIELPAFGYATQFVPPKGSVFADGLRIENEWYSVMASPLHGGIVSIIDKKNNGRELIKHNGSANRYLYESERIPIGLNQVHITSRVEAGRAILRIEGSALRTALTTEVVLYSDVDRIDIRNRLEKSPSSERQNVMFTFDFDVPEGGFAYDNAGAIIRPGLVTEGGDMLPGAGQEFYSARNFMDYSNEEFGVTISPLQSYMFMLGRNGYDECPNGPTGERICAVAFTNHAYKEILRDQGGCSSFRFDYALKAHKEFNPFAAYAFGNGFNNPVISAGAGGIPEHAGSIIPIRAESTVVTALKPALEGDGILMRLWNLGEMADEVAIDLSLFNPAEVAHCDLLERRTGQTAEIRDGAVTISVPPRGYASIVFSSR